MAPPEIAKTTVGVAMFVAVAGISRARLAVRTRMWTHAVVIIGGAVGLLAIERSTAAWIVVPLWALLLTYLAAFSWRER